MWWTYECCNKFKINALKRIEFAFSASTSQFLLSFRLNFYSSFQILIMFITHSIYILSLLLPCSCGCTFFCCKGTLCEFLIALCVKNFTLWFMMKLKQVKNRLHWQKEKLNERNWHGRTLTLLHMSYLATLHIIKQLELSFLCIKWNALV